MKKIVFGKNVTAGLIILIITFVLSVNVFAEVLTGAQKVRIMDAVNLLDTMGEKEWSEDIKEWLEKDLIESSAENSENAKTSSWGRIRVRDDI